MFTIIYLSSILILKFFHRSVKKKSDFIYYLLIKYRKTFLIKNYIKPELLIIFSQNKDV